MVKVALEDYVVAIVACFAPEFENFSYKIC